MALEKLASSLGVKDEEPNIALANEIVQNSKKDPKQAEEEVKELIDGLSHKKDIANDSIKVLYEIWEQEPKLIAPYVDVFLEGLLSKNNRLVWGSMMALNKVAALEPDRIFEQLDQIIAAYNSGSVITIDNAIGVLAQVSQASPEYEEVIFPFLLAHLGACRPKEVPQHAERITAALNENNKSQFVEVLNDRRADLTVAQNKRVEKLLKTM